MNNIYSSNFEILTLPVCGGKTTKAIEYAVKEALEKRVVFITFDASDMWLRERFKSKRDEYLEKHSKQYLRNRNALVKNLRVFTFPQPINGSALDNIIEAEKPEVIVFDGIEFFETKTKWHLPWENRKAFNEYTRKRRDIKFFVTEQAPCESLMSF